MLNFVMYYGTPKQIVELLKIWYEDISSRVRLEEGGGGLVPDKVCTEARMQHVAVIDQRVHGSHKVERNGGLSRCPVGWGSRERDGFSPCRRRDVASGHIVDDGLYGSANGESYSEILNKHQQETTIYFF